MSARIVLKAIVDQAGAVSDSPRVRCACIAELRERLCPVSTTELGLLVGVVVVVAALILRRASGASSTLNAAIRLEIHWNERSDYIVYVALPIPSPNRWEQVTNDESDCLVTNSGRTIMLRDVEGFVVAYPNGQVVDAEFLGLPPPRAIHFLPEDGDVDETPFDYDTTQKGQSRVGVEYGPSPANPGDKSHYRTTLRNLTDQPIRVTGFSAAFVKFKRNAPVRLEPGRLYGVDEFVNWYGADEDGWLQPGAIVSDPNNWGAPPVVWIYRCETLDGTNFVTGRLREQIDNA
ncbi:MAG: hypothetical protein JKY56_19520 [Kofleriaceae bacterium]|nr:hypothetical protein [Kofleriaceae bacterium]